MLLTYCNISKVTFNDKDCCILFSEVLTFSASCFISLCKKKMLQTREKMLMANNRIQMLFQYIFNTVLKANLKLLFLRFACLRET